MSEYLDTIHFYPGMPCSFPLKVYFAGGTSIRGYVNSAHARFMAIHNAEVRWKL
jgi:hypothetical protein